MANVNPENEFKHGTWRGAPVQSKVPKRSPDVGDTQFEELLLIHDRVIPSDLNLLGDVLAEIAEAMDRPACRGDVEGTGPAGREALGHKPTKRQSVEGLFLSDMLLRRACVGFVLTGLFLGALPI